MPKLYYANFQILIFFMVTTGKMFTCCNVQETHYFSHTVHCHSTSVAPRFEHFTYAPVMLRPRLPKAQSALIGQLSRRSIASILCGPQSACTYRLPPVEMLTQILIEKRIISQGVVKLKKKKVNCIFTDAFVTMQAYGKKNFWARVHHLLLSQGLAAMSN